MAYFLQYTLDSKNNNAKGHHTTMHLLNGNEKEANKALTTEAHLLLWRYLRLLELRGISFIRHASIGGHYVDFLNMEKGLVMEVDAGRRRKADKLELERKDRWLAKQGFTVLRFTEEQIFDDMNSVLDIMWESFIGGCAPPITTADNSASKADPLDKTPAVVTFSTNVTPIEKASVASISGRLKQN